MLTQSQCLPVRCVAVSCSELQCVAVCSSQLSTALTIELLNSYGVATISRLLQIIGLFCRIASLL